MTLYNAIFNEEFDKQVLEEAAVIKSSFMLHTKAKNAILPSWEKHRWPLIRNILYGDFTKHMEPIQLIADYYGEKQALYFAFLIHHISYMMIPAFFGLILWGYQISVGMEKAEAPGFNKFLISYFGNLDVAWNYPYLVMLAIWSTLYIESWKRKQNTIKYIWASS